LPALDAILLSHMHGDHWDRIATRSLPKGTPVVTTAEAAKCLADRGFTATAELAAWQTHELTRGTDTLRLTSVPGIHGPGPLVAVLPQVMGSVVELVRDGTTGPEVSWRGYISGDTLYRPFLGEVLERCGPLDVLIPAPGRHQSHGNHRDDGRPAGRRPRRAAEAAGDRAGALRRLHALPVAAR
jgi:L-ascorbate metabolism protein UlaG (beta-lactamase superfamily)